MTQSTAIMIAVLSLLTLTLLGRGLSTEPDFSFRGLRSAQSAQCVAP